MEVQYRTCPLCYRIVLGCVQVITYAVTSFLWYCPPLTWQLFYCLGASSHRQPTSIGWQSLRGQQACTRHLLLYPCSSTTSPTEPSLSISPTQGLLTKLLQGCGGGVDGLNCAVELLVGTEKSIVSVVYRWPHPMLLKTHLFILFNNRTVRYMNANLHQTKSNSS